MNFDEVKRTCQWAMDKAIPGSPHRFAHAEALTILQRPNISPFQADELLLGQRARYLALYNTTELPAEDRIYWGEVYEHLRVIGLWVRHIAEEDRKIYGEL